MHRGYHVLAIPSWERKIRVLAVWLTADVFGRDIVSLMSVQHLRDAFVAGLHAHEADFVGKSSRDQRRKLVMNFWQD